MDAGNIDIHIGDVPALLFVPGPLPPDVVIPAEQILVIQIPSLYVFVRDLVVADQQTRLAQQNSAAVQQMLRALLQFKPDGNNIVSDKLNGENAYRELEEQWNSEPSDDSLPPNHPHHKKDGKE